MVIIPFLRAFWENDERAPCYDDDLRIDGMPEARQVESNDLTAWDHMGRHIAPSVTKTTDLCMAPFNPISSPLNCKSS